MWNDNAEEKLQNIGTERAKQFTPQILSALSVSLFRVFPLQWPRIRGELEIKLNDFNAKYQQLLEVQADTFDGSVPSQWGPC